MRPAAPIVMMLFVLAHSVAAQPDADDVPLDGSLDLSGEITDANDGHLNEPAAIVASVSSCVDKVPEGSDPKVALAYCGCFTDWLRTTTPRTARAFMKAVQTGDLSNIDMHPIQACATWAAAGMHKPLPNVRKKMMPSVEVMQRYLACSRTTLGSRPHQEGMKYCNRIVGSLDKSLRTH